MHAAAAQVDVLAHNLYDLVIREGGPKNVPCPVVSVLDGGVACGSIALVVAGHQDDSVGYQKVAVARRNHGLDGLIHLHLVVACSVLSLPSLLEDLPQRLGSTLSAFECVEVVFPVERIGRRNAYDLDWRERHADDGEWIAILVRLTSEYAVVLLKPCVADLADRMVAILLAYLLGGGQ